MPASSSTPMPRSAGRSIPCSDWTTRQHADRTAVGQRRERRRRPDGAINLRKHMVYEEESPAVGLEHLERHRQRASFNHYPTGWAQVSNTPLKWYKKDTHGGGIRAPFIVHWPRRIPIDGAVRSAISSRDRHCPDALRTPRRRRAAGNIHGAPQLPSTDQHGVHVRQPAAPTRKETQYFEILGDRAIWHQGWKAVARHPRARISTSDRWELYHLDADFSEIDDLAAREPERLRALLVDMWRGRPEVRGRAAG